MTPEEFQKIKEAEKEHLRALKKLKQAVRGLEQRNKVTKAVTDIASSTSSLLDEHESLVEKLAHETALQEARLELAMESAEERAKQDEADAVTDAIDRAAADEELAKKRASDLVKQMKTQMSAPEKTERSSASVEERPAEVEKTIGRSRSEEPVEPAAKAETPRTSDTDAPAESDVPEKTIGRMKPRK